MLFFAAKCPNKLRYQYCCCYYWSIKYAHVLIFAMKLTRQTPNRTIDIKI